MFPITTVNHLSMSGVADYAKTRDWYVDLFGMRVVWDDGIEKCALEMGPAESPNGIYVVQGKPGSKAMIGHFGLGVRNWWTQKQAMKDEMERRGLKNIRPDGEAGWMVDMPSGYMIQPIPEKDQAMYPGAAEPCKDARSEECRRGWESGLKNLASLPKPSGEGFRCVAFRPVVLHTPSLAADRDFYRDLWGMKVLSEREEGGTAECLMSFGENTLCLRKTAKPDEKPYCHEYSFLALDYDHAKAEEKLKRRGLNPEADRVLGWAFSDPNGLRVGVRGA